MKVAIVGFEVEGKSAFDYWKKLGSDITICDMDPNKVIPDGIESQLGEGYLNDLDRFDVIVRTAGLHPNLILELNPTVREKITTINDEFLRACNTRHIIGVTGTKGKGTTTTLITKMLQASGKQVFLGGNIGVPCLEFIDQINEESWVVLELSSYQLTDIRHSPSIAVCLTISPEHLNWHKDMDDYMMSKARLFQFQLPNDLAVYYALNDDSRKIASYSPGLKLPYFAPPGAHVNNQNIVIDNEIVCRTGELKLIGEHNWQNVCAAVTVVWQIVPSISIMRSVLTTFAGLEHRLELIREIDDIRFFNDSYASGPGAAIAALEAINGSKVLIMGGFDRGLPLDDLATAVKNHELDLRKVILIGASAQRLADQLTVVGFNNYKIENTQYIEEIVGDARAEAQPGDAIVFSPGFASFDMFKNFTERGEMFKTAVNSL